MPGSVLAAAVQIKFRLFEIKPKYKLALGVRANTRTCPVSCTKAFRTMKIKMFAGCLRYQPHRWRWVSWHTVSWFCSVYLSAAFDILRLLVLSETCAVSRGVPQGSVLGPLPFSLCLLPLGVLLM